MSNHGPGRFSDMKSTDWVSLRGPRAYEYFSEHYANALHAVIAGCLARRLYPPFRPQDAPDLLQEFFLALLRSNWLLTYPKQEKGRFRTVLYGRLRLFLGERSGRARRKPSPAELAEDPAVEDQLLALFEAEWAKCTVQLCLERVSATDPDAGALLRTTLTQGTTDQGALAEQLAWPISRVRRVRTRANKLWVRALEAEAQRLDDLGSKGPGGGGPQPEPPHTV